LVAAKGKGGSDTFAREYRHLTLAHVSAFADTWGMERSFHAHVGTGITASIASPTSRGLTQKDEKKLDIKNRRKKHGYNIKDLLVWDR
jgi:hypothetical protein